MKHTHSTCHNWLSISWTFNIWKMVSKADPLVDETRHYLHHVRRLALTSPHLLEDIGVEESFTTANTPMSRPAPTFDRGHF